MRLPQLGRKDCPRNGGMVEKGCPGYPYKMVMRRLFGMDDAELAREVARLEQRPYRVRQIFEALYKQRVESLDAVTTLPLELRERIAADGLAVGLPEMVQTAKSVDGTERYLMRMADGETVETVWMPDGDGGERGDGSEAAVEEAGRR